MADAAVVFVLSSDLVDDDLGLSSDLVLVAKVVGTVTALLAVFVAELEGATVEEVLGGFL